MSNTDTQVKQLAEEAYACFETALRDESDEDTRFTRVKEGSPQWVTDLCHEAHGEMFPDDWRYERVSSALECIREADDADNARHEWADAEVDVYIAPRLQWLASHLHRANYVDEAVEEMGYPAGVVEMIAYGQYREADEVFGLVLAFLERKAEGDS